MVILVEDPLWSTLGQEMVLSSPIMTPTASPLAGIGQFTIERLSNAYYRSTLIVTGVLPGVYQYSVNNKATPTSMDRDFNIEGNRYTYYYHIIFYTHTMEPVCS